MNAGQGSYGLRFDRDRIVDQRISEVLANSDTVIGDGDSALLRDRPPPPWPRYRKRQCCVVSARFSDGGERTFPPKHRGQRLGRPVVCFRPPSARAWRLCAACHAWLAKLKKKFLDFARRIVV
jgi:hypothetical protein